MIHRCKAIAAKLRMLEAGRGKAAPIHAGDPRLVRWVAAGISDPQLREAYERARYALQQDGRQDAVTVGFMSEYVAGVISEGDKAQQGCAVVSRD